MCDERQRRRLNGVWVTRRASRRERAPKALALLVLPVLALAGCSGDGLSLGQVSGTVTLDGKPLPKARVVFTPEGAGRPALGITDEQGRYVLQFTLSRPGALVGQHQVRVSTGDIDLKGRAVKEVVPPRYHSKGSIDVTVNSGKNVIDLPLTSD